MAERARYPPPKKYAPPKNNEEGVTVKVPTMGHTDGSPRPFSAKCNLFATGHQGSLGRRLTAADMTFATVYRDCPGQGGSDVAGFFLRNFGLALRSGRILV